MYSGDPKTGHSKTGNIRKLVILKVGLNPLKTGPFDNRPTLEHLKTGHVRFPDPRCTFQNSTKKSDF